MTANRQTAPAIPAATLMLLRDGAAGLEVLMMTRHDQSGFAAGAQVFPGGRLEAADHRLAEAFAHLAPAAGASLPLRIAAIREAYEECGLLLARRDGRLLGGAEMAALPEGPRDGEGFAALVAAAGLEPAVDMLVPFAHWITPEGGPKRFDTHFFLAAAPAEQVAAADGREAVALSWTAPSGPVAVADAGGGNLVFATYMNLSRLNRHGDTATALAAARLARVVTVMPTRVETVEGVVFRIPAEAGYDFTDMPLGKLRRA